MVLSGSILCSAATSAKARAYRPATAATSVSVLSQLGGEIAHQHLIGLFSYLDSLRRQLDSQFAGVSLELPASGAGGGGNLLFCGGKDATAFLLNFRLNALFLHLRVFIGLAAHLRDLRIQTRKSALYARQAPLRLLAGSARFLNSPLDGFIATAEEAGSALLVNPKQERHNNREVQYNADPVGR